jgi:predicted MFS family arabinose efflux permease
VLIRQVRTVPGVPAMAAWSLVGRFGLGMTNLSLLLFVRAETGSYAVAGGLSAASLLGVATGTVVQGRMIDRSGPRRPLLLLALPHLLLGAAVIVGVAASLPPAALAVVIVAQCAVLPSVAVASRSMWPRLLPAGPSRDAAYTYEAISFELCWLLGPAVAGLLATLLWPGTALTVAVALATVAAVGFARTPVVRSHRGQGRAAGGGERPGAGPPRGDVAAPVQSIRRGGLAVLLIAVCGFGLAIGYVVVGVTAGTAAAGAPEMAGVLLAGWSISSMAGGLAYQRWLSPPHGGLASRLPVLLSIFALVLLIPGGFAGVVALAVSLALAGLTLVPQITTHNSLLDGLVPGRRLSEAYGWLTMTIWVANAAGQAAGGLVIDRAGHQAGFVAATACVLALAVVVWIGRRRMAATVAQTSRQRYLTDLERS